MVKVREMNRSIFKDNLLMTVYEIIDQKQVEEDRIKFKVIPILEKDKPHNATDEVMRLVVFSEKNIDDRLLKVEEIVRLATCRAPFVPIWINISLNRIEKEEYIFNFETSLRCRKPSLLRNAETGHPPFKAVK